MTELIFAMVVALVWQTTLRVLLLVFARCERRNRYRCARIASTRTCSIRRMHGVRSPVLTVGRCVQ
jgi:hypothetical protein